MKKITVYGPGCARCKETEELVLRVLAEKGIAADVEKVSDIKAMVKAGILSTPAVAVDGVVKVSGRIPRAEEVESWLGAPPSASVPEKSTPDSNGRQRA